MPSPIHFVTSFCPLEKEYSAHFERKQGYNIKRQKKLQKRKSEVISTHVNILKKLKKEKKKKINQIQFNIHQDSTELIPGTKGLTSKIKCNL